MGKRARIANRALRREDGAAAPAPARSSFRAPGPEIAVSAPESSRVLEDLALLRKRERRLARDRERLVLLARSAGVSWTSIAQSLGVSPQAVQQKYGRRS